MTERISLHWVNVLHLRKAKRFMRFVDHYCKKHGLEDSFEAFLLHGHNGICSKTFKYIYDAPKILLANSRAFMRYYQRLPHDFQQDLLTSDELNRSRAWLAVNQSALRRLRQRMGEDSIL